MKRYFKKCCAALSVLLLCALCVAIGFALGQGPRQENSQRRLLISVDIDPEDKGKGECFTLDELSGGIADNLVYSQGISNVIIQLDDSSVELDEAIKQGKVSVNEILFLAQEDAKNHICAIDFWSAAGLNNYIFRYPEF